MKSQKKSGFSIIEILVASMFLVAITYGFFQFLSGAMKGQKNVQNAVDFDILKTSLNLVLNTKACDGAFRSGGQAVQITLPVGQNWSTLVTGTNVISAGAPLPIESIHQGSSVIISNPSTDANLGGGLSVSKLEFTNAIYDGDQTVETDPVTHTTANFKAFAATLLLEVTKQSGSIGVQKFSKTFGVRILSNPLSTPAGKVERCSSGQAKGMILCSDPDSDITNPSHNPLCARAAANNGKGDAGARVVSCPDTRFPSSIGTLGLHTFWDNTTKGWRYYDVSAAHFPCAPGTALVLTW